MQMQAKIAEQQRSDMEFHAGLQQIVGEAQAAKRSGAINPLKTPDEKYLEKLLNPSVPVDRSQLPHVKRNWLLASEAAVHLQLTNIPDPGMLFMLQNMVTDLFRVGAWDADEYFDQRQLKLESTIMMLKSIGYTKNPRERDALNESRFVNTVRDERARPRESTGFVDGLIAGRR
jgi:hypothetical protein